MKNQPEASTSKILSSLSPKRTLEEIRAETERLEAELKLQELQGRLENLEKQKQLEAEKKAAEEQNKAKKLDSIKARFNKAVALWDEGISADEAAECDVSHRCGYTSMCDGSYEREACQKILLALAKETMNPPSTC